MKKFIITAGALVALVVPTAAMASQPVIPGGFGTERASNIKSHPYPSYTGEWFSGIAGDNGTDNQAWMDSHDYLPVESSISTP